MPKLTLAQMKQALAASTAAKRKPSKPRVLPLPVKTSDYPALVKQELARPLPVKVAPQPSKPLKRAVMDALLPCPFCQSTKVMLEEGVCYPCVRCDDCCAHGPYIYYRVGTEKTPEQSATIKLWNAAKR
jgi:hypothetical protein